MNASLAAIRQRWRQIRYRAYFPIIDRLRARLARAGGPAACVRERIAGDDPLAQSASVAVYVHYDPSGEVADYVVDQLRHLVRAGFRVTFVTNAPRFPEAARARVSPLCREMLWRVNRGLDFGGYRDGLTAVGDLERLDRVVLMNDSVYGPFRELKPILDGVDPGRVDYWGIIDSFEQTPHIQSFFLLFFGAAFKSDAFGRFWRSMPLIDDKGWVVRNGEVGLSRCLRKAGLRGGTLVSYAEAAAHLEKERPADPAEQRFWRRARLRVRGRIPLNPMHYFWDIIILEFGCPFIKRDLLRLNPANVPSLSRWQSVIAARSAYDLTMIQRHLAAASQPAEDRSHEQP
ncbi:MAG: rhamnan synthesis F family protein [Xanthobacteraceae bacterium]|nr:rhamnan synthesis F family protein [Xanthobacteraceae bacterium]